jgi:hypothetical protein
VKNPLLTALLAAVFAIAQSGAADACACCTNPGQRYVESTKLEAYRLDLVRELRFAPRANLQTGARDLADYKGISNPSGSYALTVEKRNDRFVFSFRDDRKNEGTITLVLPDAIAVFEVDPRDPDAPKNGLGPQLYKEWRLVAPFAGTGIFKAGNGGYQRIALIFHGRGLGCTEASHFSGWTISVYGPLGNYLFYGDLKQQ